MLPCELEVDDLGKKIEKAWNISTWNGTPPNHRHARMTWCMLARARHADDARPPMSVWRKFLASFELTQNQSECVNFVINASLQHVVKGTVKKCCENVTSSCIKEQFSFSFSSCPSFKCWLWANQKKVRQLSLLPMLWVENCSILFNLRRFKQIIAKLAPTYEK